MARQQFSPWLRRSIALGALTALTVLPAAADQAPSASGPAPVSVSAQISGAESAGPQRVLLTNSSTGTYAQAIAVQSAGPQIQAPAASVVMVITQVSGAESAGPQRLEAAGR